MRSCVSPTPTVKLAEDDKKTSEETKPPLKPAARGRIKNAMTKARERLLKLRSLEYAAWNGVDRGLGKMFRKSGEWSYFEDKESGKKRRRIVEGVLATVAVGAVAYLEVKGSGGAVHHAVNHTAIRRLHSLG